MPVNALVEMVFEMPEEISGQKNSNVLCQGRIIRSKENRAAEDGAGPAAADPGLQVLAPELSLRVKGSRPLFRGFCPPIPPVLTFGQSKTT